MKTTYDSEGSYNLTKLNLIKGYEVIDLTGIFIDIAIYESMFDQVISGDISLIDTKAIDERTPLVGNEKIEIEFYTAGNDSSPIKITGLVYSIDPKNRISQTASGFIIRFADEFLIKSSRMAYRYGHQCEISKMVQYVYKNTMGSDAKSFEAVDTIGIDHFVGNKIPPLKVINKVSDRARSKSGDYGYMFYQDNRKFNFKPLQYLFQQDPTTEFINVDQGVYRDVKQKAVERFTAIQKIEIDPLNNTYSERIARGHHGTRWYSIDIQQKQVIKSDWSKTANFNSEKSLGNHPELFNDIDQEIDGMHYSEVQRDVSQGLADKQKNTMIKDCIFTFRAYITVMGDSSLCIGQTAKVNLPNWDNRGDASKVNPYDGKFLITEIKHVLTKRSYIQSITVQKDAYQLEYLQ